MAPVANTKALIIRVSNLMRRDVAPGGRSPLPLALLIPPPLHEQGGPCGEGVGRGGEVDGDVHKRHTEASVSSLWGTSNATGQTAYLVHEMTVRDTCPACSMELEEEEVRRGWRMDEQDYTTQCSQCSHRFVARFTVRSFHATHHANNVTHVPQDNLDETGEVVAEGVATRGAGAVASTHGRDGREVYFEERHSTANFESLSFQYLSPAVVHKEVATLLRHLGSVAPSPRPLPPTLALCV